MSSIATPEQMAEIKTAEEQEQQAIVAYIEQRLGKELAAYYHDAIRESVGTGCYSRDWTHSQTRPKIAAYTDNLVALFLKQNGKQDWLIRCTMVMALGTAERRAQLMELLYPEERSQEREEHPAISAEEREQIIDLARQGVARREMCGQLGWAHSKYSVVKSVLDAYEEQA